MKSYTAMGRLTRDTETRAAGGGNVTSISIAVDTPWKDKSGESIVSGTSSVTEQYRVAWDYFDAHTGNYSHTIYLKGREGDGANK